MNFRVLDIPKLLEVDTFARPDYAFVDADNLSESFKRHLNQFSFDPSILQKFYFNRLFGHGKHDRVYLFSAQHEADTEPDWLKRLSSTPKFIVKVGRLRKVNGRTKQEGVDVKLAIDATRLGLHGINKTATLYTGDGDFLPLVEALTDSGVYVRVISFNDPELGDVAPRLRALSDQYYRINSPWVFSTFDGARSVTPQSLSDFVWHRSSYSEIHQISGRSVEVRKHGGTFIIAPNTQNPTTCFGSEDIESLLVWFAMNTEDENCNS